MSNKNLSQTLYFSQFGGERPIPEQFLAAMDRAEERTKVPLDFPLPELSDEIVEARFDFRYENTNEKQLVVIKKKNGVIGPLSDFRTTDQGQSVQVSSTMFRKADTSFVQAEPDEFQDVSVKDLGNGWSIQEVAVMGVLVDGVFTPTLFQGIELEQRRDDPVPAKFAVGLPVTQAQSIVAGTVAAPTLGADDLRKSERQIALHRKILTTLTRAGITLPFSLVGKRTNERKQVVVITDTYRVATTTPSVSTTQDVQITDLGDGHEVATTEVIPSLFGAENYTKQIEDLIPPRFRGLLPTTLTRQIISGTAAMPTLGAGELKRTEEQITVLTKLVEVLSRAGVSFPIPLTDTATITEYGGGLVSIDSVIDVAGTMAPLEGEGVVSSKVTKLGEGHELRETVTRSAGSWPTLPFSQFNPRLQVLESGTKQVVGKGTTTPGISGAVVTEQVPLDGYRETKVVTTQPLAEADLYVRVLHNNTNVYVPPQLVSIQGYYSRDGGAGSYTENGNYTISAPGVGGLQLRGSAQASASVVPEATWVVKIPRTQNIPCRHVLLYVLNTATRAHILTAVNVALGSPGLSAWPTFRPQQVLLLLKGGKVNGRLEISATAHDSLAIDYAGVVKFSGNSRTNGGGISVDISRVSRLVQLPETIHSTISSIGGEGASATEGPWGATGSITCGAATSQPIGGAATAVGSIEIKSGGGGTTGDETIPSSGQFLHRLVTEPDPAINRVKVFAEVVDFADIYVS